MAHVEIYTTQVCPYCVRAKDLLQRKGVTPIEFRVDLNDSLRDQMLQRAQGRRTVPQSACLDKPQLRRDLIAGGLSRGAAPIGRPDGGDGSHCLDNRGRP